MSGNDYYPCAICGKVGYQKWACDCHKTEVEKELQAKIESLDVANVELRDEIVWLKAEIKRLEKVSRK